MGKGVSFNFQRTLRCQCLRIRSMKINLILVFLVFNIILLHVVPAQSCVFESSRTKKTFRHRLPNGTTVRCNVCPAGHKMVKKCTGSTPETQTVCEECSQGYYLTWPNKCISCRACESCPRYYGLTPLQNCSSTTASICGCLPGWQPVRFSNEGKIEWCEKDLPKCPEGSFRRGRGCQKHKVCVAGEETVERGTPFTDTVCRRCPRGTYNRKASGTAMCKPHRKCVGEPKRKGSRKRNTLCSEYEREKVTPVHSTINLTLEGTNSTSTAMVERTSSTSSSITEKTQSTSRAKIEIPHIIINDTVDVPQGFIIGPPKLWLTSPSPVAHKEPSNTIAPEQVTHPINNSSMKYVTNTVREIDGTTSPLLTDENELSQSDQPPSTERDKDFITDYAEDTHHLAITPGIAPVFETSSKITKLIKAIVGILGVFLIVAVVIGCLIYVRGKRKDHDHSDTNNTSSQTGDPEHSAAENVAVRIACHGNENTITVNAHTSHASGCSAQSQFDNPAPANIRVVLKNGRVEHMLASDDDSSFDNRSSGEVSEPQRVYHEPLPKNVHPPVKKRRPRKIDRKRRNTPFSSSSSSNHSQGEQAAGIPCQQLPPSQLAGPSSQYHSSDSRDFSNPQDVGNAASNGQRPAAHLPPGGAHNVYMPETQNERHRSQLAVSGMAVQSDRENVVRNRAAIVGSNSAESGVEEGSQSDSG